MLFVKRLTLAIMLSFMSEGAIAQTPQQPQSPAPPGRIFPTHKTPLARNCAHVVESFRAVEPARDGLRECTPTTSGPRMQSAMLMAEKPVAAG